MASKRLRLDLDPISGEGGGGGGNHDIPFGDYDPTALKIFNAGENIKGLIYSTSITFKKLLSESSFSSSADHHPSTSSTPKYATRSLNVAFSLFFKILTAVEFLQMKAAALEPITIELSNNVLGVVSLFKKKDGSEIPYIHIRQFWKVKNEIRYKKNGLCCDLVEFRLFISMLKDMERALFQIAGEHAHKQVSNFCHLCLSLQNRNEHVVQYSFAEITLQKLEKINDRISNFFKINPPGAKFLISFQKIKKTVETGEESNANDGVDNTFLKVVNYKLDEDHVQPPKSFSSPPTTPPSPDPDIISSYIKESE